MLYTLCRTAAPFPGQEAPAEAAHAAIPEAARAATAEAPPAAASDLHHLAATTAPSPLPPAAPSAPGRISTQPPLLLCMGYPLQAAGLPPLRPLSLMACCHLLAPFRRALAHLGTWRQILWRECSSPCLQLPPQTQCWSTSRYGPLHYYLQFSLVTLAPYCTRHGGIMLLLSHLFHLGRGASGLQWSQYDSSDILAWKHRCMWCAITPS